MFPEFGKTFPQTRAIFKNLAAPHDDFLKSPRSFTSMRSRTCLLDILQSSKLASSLFPLRDLPKDDAVHLFPCPDFPEFFNEEDVDDEMLHHSL